jgi:hypothetical protein
MNGTHSNPEIIMRIIPYFSLLPALSLAFIANTAALAELPQPDEVIEPGTATMDAAVVEEATLLDVPPQLTEAQLEQLQAMTDRTGLPGPVLPEGEQAPVTSGPEPGTESQMATDTPLLMDEAANGDTAVEPAPAADSTFTIFRKKNLYDEVPSIAGDVSNVTEASVGVGSKYIMYTGNWFAARSDNAGRTWSYVNPYSGYSDFCCDQRVLYEPSRDMFLWLRMGVPDSNGVNTFKLSVSKNAFGSAYITYTIAPTAVNSDWTNQWWDYPEMQVTADYLFITWNMFSQAGSYVRSVVLRWPLTALSTGSGFSFNYYSTTAWASLVPVSGADHTMWFASNWPNSAPQNSRIGIWRWHDDATGLTFWDKTVTAWTFTNRNTAVCGSTSGNWLARGDQRLQSGARYRIQGTDTKDQGKNALAWFWNVKQGGDFPYPYIEAAAFYEDTLNQPAGSDARPYVWSTATCFGYPAVSPNERGDLGLVMHYGVGPDFNPDIIAALSDDFTATPPGWSINLIRASISRPNTNTWGDYNTSRKHIPSGVWWVGGAHWSRYPQNGTGARPQFWFMGRGRDWNDFYRWHKR